MCIRYDVHAYIIRAFSVIIISEISLPVARRLFMQRAQVRYGAGRSERDCSRRLRPRKDDTTAIIRRRRRPTEFRLYRFGIVPITFYTYAQYCNIISQFVRRRTIATVYYLPR